MDSNKINTHKDNSRLPTLVILVLLANALMVILLYRYHDYALDQSATQHETVRTMKESEAMVLKEEIRTLEGVATWGETAFASFFHQQ